MTLFFPCFAFFIVNSFLMTAVSAIPVTQTTTTITQQIHETETKQTNTPADMFTQRSENLLPTNLEHYQTNSSETEEKIVNDTEKKDDFRSCKVSNVTYLHREPIPRSDPCEMCVCVDSEMYCLWKLCTFFNLMTVTSAPSTVSTANHKTKKQSINDNKIIFEKSSENDVKINEINTTNEKFSKILLAQRKYNALRKLELTSPKALVETQKSTVSEISTPKVESVACYVMGVMYKYGEVLPRDTGTCLECTCSDGGRVTCSPKDCVSQPDLDYLSHNNNLDIFDIDTF